MRKYIKIILPIVLIGFTIYALDWLAVINVQEILHSVPVVGKIVPAPKNQAGEALDSSSTSKASNDEEIQTLKKENLNLKKQIKNLKKQRDQLRKTNSDLEAQQAQQQTDQNNQTGQTNQTSQTNQNQPTGYKVLASYYADMKPANAVAIMNNLDDDTIIGILSNMDSDQAGKILAAMDPKRAANIVRKMT